MLSKTIQTFLIGKNTLSGHKISGYLAIQCHECEASSKNGIEITDD